MAKGYSGAHDGPRALDGLSDAELDQLITDALLRKLLANKRYGLFGKRRD